MAATIADVEVSDRGRVVSRIRAPRHVPRVRLRKPRIGRTATSFTVTWKTSDPDRGRRIAFVSVSVDGGRHYTTVFEGIDRGRAPIPVAALKGSRRARVRVTVSDGFHFGVATSARFAAPALVKPGALRSPPGRASSRATASASSGRSRSRGARRRPRAADALECGPSGQDKGDRMPFELPPLPYAANALEPHIDEQTMTIHHDKHHGTYVTNLNAALEGTALAGSDIEDVLRDLGAVPEDKRGAVRNNGGGHYNHTMFWENMTPGGGGEPDGALGEALASTFGSFADFQAQLKDAGLKRFGSGWAWLVHAGSGLAIVSTPNQDNPISDGQAPLLGVDVWEHAYYLKYQNRRPDYIDAWWNTVNWSRVAERFAAAG